MNRHLDVRYIYTGHGVAITCKTVHQIAADRAGNLCEPGQHTTFIDAFERIRLAVLKGYDTETLWRSVRGNDLLLSAYVEALASLRAEGHRL